MRCTYPGCGSYAINPGRYGRAQGVNLELCDVHYWKARSERYMEALARISRRCATPSPNATVKAVARIANEALLADESIG